MEKQLKSHSCKVCNDTTVENFYAGGKSMCKKCISVKNKANYATLDEEAKLEKAQYANAWQKNNIMRTRFLAAKNRYKDKEYEFTITEEFITTLILKQNYRCAISGKTFDIEDPRYSPSLERVDSNKGYTAENVMWVCSMVNYMKAEYSQDDFYEMIERIYKKRQADISM